MIYRFLFFCAAALLMAPAAARADVFAFVEPADVLELAADRQVTLDYDGRRAVDVAGVRGRGEAFLYRLDGPPQTRTLPGSYGRRMGIAAGDLDGDGRDDLLATFDRSGTLVVLSGQADGQLAPPVTYQLRDPVKETRATAVAVGDADGDGDLDVFAAFDGAVTVLLNDGKTLTPRNATLPVGAPADLAFADGRLFVLDAAAPADANLRVYSAPAFRAPHVYAGGALPTTLATGDLDGDGQADVAVGHARDVLGERAPVRLLSGSALHATTLAAGALAIADTDRDGHADVVVADGDAPDRPSAPGLVRGTGTLALGAPAWSREPEDGPEHDPRVADLDGDGKADLVTIGAGGDVLIRYGAGPQLVPAGDRSAFGPTPLGARTTTTIQFTNAGGGTARELALWPEGDASAFDLDLGTCAGAVLAHGQACQIRVAFAPHALGPAAAAVGLIAGDSDLVWMHALDGTGVAVVAAATPAPAPAPTATPAPARLAVPKVRRVTRAALLRRGLRFSQRVNERATVTWTLESAGRVVASTTVRLGEPRTVKLTLRLTPRGRRLLRRTHARTLTLRARSGGARTVTKIKLAR
ncbi:MAG TPA: VCBS repeat-containing protein [Solirubrobacter sp.]|nr:VCBS repeat-containing protein [Solirubrobacter sp.]